MPRKPTPASKPVPQHWAKYLAENPDFAVFVKASEAHEEGDIRSAHRLFRRSANMGCLPAMLMLANILADDIKPPRPAEAVYWYKRAVRRGCYDSAWNLSIHYKLRNQERWRVHWLRRAAALGHEDAIAELGSRA